MKGDFTRDTFDATKHFSRVLMQQGRVQLDADWNEQAAILLHYLQTLAADLIGPHGGPLDAFKIDERADNEGNTINQDFFIGPGHYYVDGILCENDFLRDENGEPASLPYTEQPDYPNPIPLDHNGTYLVYLDVWERHISYIEDGSDDNPSIREIALGSNGPDTATRSKVVWQVKIHTQENGTCPDYNSDWKKLVDQWQPTNRGQLKAMAKASEDADTDPCITPPEARYRGAENQLYRVEVHTGGNTNSGGDTRATFKWSRDNGSVVFPILKLTPSENDSESTKFMLEHLGRDDRSGLQPGDWVEIVDDDYILHERDRQESVPLLKVKTVDRVNSEVILEGTYAYKVGEDVVGRNPDKHPLLRRWDQKGSDGGLQLVDGAALIVEGKGDSDWLLLEDGLRIQFQKLNGGSDETHQYRPGDYWLIPARTATGDVEWPGPVGDPQPEPPNGVVHHYAPLAIISPVGTTVQVKADCRRTFEPLGTSAS